jgi:hypothetical protein
LYGGRVTKTTFPDLERWSQTVDHRLDHLTNAVGDLSQGQRALAFDMREVKRDLHGVSLDLEETRATVSRIEQAQATHSEMLRTHGEMLRTILTRLDAR